MEKHDKYSKRGDGVAKEVTDDYSGIDEVIAYIHKHIDEPLQLSRLADIALYSPFHFTRIFKEKIGLSPMYYVSALRLQKAKDLLLQTNLTIRDIGLEIGQQSLGTFTTRFTERVGARSGSALQVVAESERLGNDVFCSALRQLHDRRRDLFGRSVRRLHPDWLVCQAHSRRIPVIRDAASFLGTLSFYGCQARHLLFDGNVRLLGDADEGFPAAACDLAYQSARADYRSTLHACPLPGSHASSRPARRSPDSGIFAAPYAELSSSKESIRAAEVEFTVPFTLTRKACRGRPSASLHPQ